MAPRKTPKLPLSRDRIIDAAMAIIDNEGIDGLSMRKLGARLKVEAMSLYYYVANKDALLDLLVERLVMKAATAPEAQSGNWQERLRGFTRHFYATLVASPRALPLLATHHPRSTAAMTEFAGAIGGLAEAGFAPVEAYCILNSLALMAFGHALAVVDHPEGETAEANMADQIAYFDYLAKLFKDPQALTERHQKLFEFALKMFLDGLALQRQRAAHPHRQTD
jgi:TetR/AcrR family tetracycline transcriptional repressor